jgi:putative DNA primase/helicase
MPHPDVIGYLSATNSAELVSPPLGDAQSTEPDSIIAECPPEAQGEKLELGGTLCSIGEKILTPEHEAHIAGRGLLNPWARACCISVTAAQASHYLGKKVQSAGILFMGQNGQVQCRLDTPKKKQNGKDQKYDSPVGEFDALIPPSPDNPLYWEIEALKRNAFYINGVPYILLTEGVFKALAGCSNGIPTISLLGVEQGLTGKDRDAENKRFLVAALRRLAEAGFGFIIGFDADALTNPNICTAERKLAKQLVKFNVPVRSVTGCWEKGPNGEFKGMDDFIQHKGIEEFRAILGKAKLFGEKENTTENQEKKGKQLPPPSQIADELAETYRDKLAWESEFQLWRRYGAKCEGVWDVETTESVKRLVQTHLRAQGLPGFNAGYVSSVLDIMKSDLEVQDWNEQTGLIPLQDGVLNQLTQELKPHKPGYRFTWQLPFKWADRSVGCEPIEQFLLKITGNQSIADVLLAFLNCIVTRQSKYQRYLELKGGGGTGKSTFMALARALAGDNNTVASQLKHLENNQFETAKFYGKILALFPDSERWQGEVSVLKQMTGQDPIRYERKGVQQCRDFIFKGMVILSANEAPESRDLTSGQERRKLTVELDIKVPEYEDAELIEQFKPFLPGLLKRVLDIPASEVTRLVKHTDREVPALAQVKWRQLCETNPIAGWLEEKAVVNADVKGYVGLGDIDQAGRWLYANFCKYQQDNGLKNSVSMKRFSLNLRDLLKNQMKVAINEGRDRDGNYIQGVGLRCQLDPSGELYPCPVTKKPFCDGLVIDCDGSVTVESLTDVGFDGYAGFSNNPQNTTENLVDSIDNQPDKLLQSSPDEVCAADTDKNPTNPSNPTSASIPAITNPSQTHHKPVKGDRVIIARSDQSRYLGARGEVIDDEVYGANGGLEFCVRFDKKISNIWQDYFPVADVLPEPRGGA